MLRITSLLFVFVLFLVGAAIVIAAEDNAAATVTDYIRGLEEQERSAVFTGDASALETIWSDHLLVNNMAGWVSISGMHLPAAAGLVVERRIEHIRVDGDIAVVMGGEIVQSPGSNRLALGRFSHVWQRGDNGWRLLVRHADDVAAIIPRVENAVGMQSAGPEQSFARVMLVPF